MKSRRCEGLEVMSGGLNGAPWTLEIFLGGFRCKLKTIENSIRLFIMLFFAYNSELSYTIHSCRFRKRQRTASAVRRVATIGMNKHRMIIFGGTLLSSVMRTFIRLFWETELFGRRV